MRWASRLAAALVLAASLAVLGPVGMTQADTVSVANQNDSRPGSLRQATADAHTGATVGVPAGTYNLLSQIDINKQLTIEGAGAGSTILDGGGTTRVVAV